MKDRTLKLLLTLIAVALWAIVLRPVWEPAPAQAQGGMTDAAKYEYGFTSGTTFKGVAESLNKAGQLGWRSIGVAVGGDGGYNTPQILVLQERRVE